jgi:hypothetical protein
VTFQTNNKRQTITTCSGHLPPAEHIRFPNNKPRHLKFASVVVFMNHHSTLRIKGMINKTLTGLITGPSLFSYIETLSLSEHDDIADSNSFATLIADEKHNRYYYPERWLALYVGVLQGIGWSVYEDSIFTKTQHFLTSSVADFLVESASAMSDTRQGNAMIDTLDSLKINSPALLAFDRASASGDSFQVIPARYDDKGIINIAVFKLELNARTKRTNFLFWTWEKYSAEIIQRKAYLKLNTTILEGHREMINERLEEKRMKRFDLSQNRPMDN